MEFREKFDECEIGDAVMLAVTVRDGLIHPEDGFELEKIQGEAYDDFAWVRKH